jgi:hypothetical protein
LFLFYTVLISNEMPGTGKEALFAIYGWKEGMKWQKSAAKTMDCRRRCFTTKKIPVAEATGI